MRRNTETNKLRDKTGEGKGGQREHVKICSCGDSEGVTKVFISPKIYGDGVSCWLGYMAANLIPCLWSPCALQLSPVF